MNYDYSAPWVNAEEFADQLVSELKREVTCGHPLWGKQVRAIARRSDSDDVIFEVQGPEILYAVVHLTWGCTPETNPDFPQTTIHRDLKSATSLPLGD